ncbi:COG1215 Glycosyltransferases, probably involved in cell wall biogenesis [Rhabdaerophilaceae bacterium]
MLSSPVSASQKPKEQQAHALSGRNTLTSSRLVELLLASGVTSDKLIVEAVRAARINADLIDLGLGEGWLDEATLLTELAAMLDCTMMTEPPQPIPGSDLSRCIELRSYRAQRPGQPWLSLVLSPNGRMIRALIEGTISSPAGRIILTRQQVLRDRLVASHGPNLARQAANTLPAELSARPDRVTGGTAGRLVVMIVPVLCVVLLSQLVIDPYFLFRLIPLLLGPVFILAASAAVLASLFGMIRTHRPPDLADAALPSYTILVPLYREERVLGALLKRLAVLDYPRDRLEVLLLVEQSDTQTRQALAPLMRSFPRSINVLVVPLGEPRTKPRALNAAMPFVRSDYMVVYDAEDAPDRDQLRLAAAAFAAAPLEVACLQARLAIANPWDGVLPMRFALDYAALFDLVKAGTARLGWPVPLGGTSNHLRTADLRLVGAWDAWNVTEDADLGIRLARFGKRVQDLPSTTWEEAPARAGTWLNQRTRWMKGWMQTLLVHARDPFQLIRQVGFMAAASLGSIGLSMIICSLMLPLVVAATLVRIVVGPGLFEGSLVQTIADSMMVISISLAIFMEFVPPAVALIRRRSFRLLPAIILAPITYLMISIASWRALYDLVQRPYHWHKTPHGLMRRAGGMGALPGSPAQDTAQKANL